jgi:hypothetical protein
MMLLRISLGTMEFCITIKGGGRGRGRFESGRKYG